MRQQLVMLEAPAEKFVKSVRYYNAVPRPTYQESRALDLKLIQKGQLEPITVNLKMTILDGYTRFELLQARGKMIKYVMRDFPTEHEEFQYVIETNIMRRQLNPFQKIETMYDLLSYERELRRIRTGKSYTDIILSIKDGNHTTIDIAKDLSVTDKYIHKMTRSMINDYYISKKDIKKKTSQGHITQYYFTLMPKADERLGKEKEAKKPNNLNMTDLTGLCDRTVNEGMHLIKKSDPEMLERLRDGKIGISTAYQVIMGKLMNPHHKKQYTKAHHKLKCPYCDQIAEKREFRRVEE